MCLQRTTIRLLHGHHELPRSTGGPAQTMVEVAALPRNIPFWSTAPSTVDQVSPDRCLIISALSPSSDVFGAIRDRVWVKSAALTACRSLPVFPHHGHCRGPSVCRKRANSFRWRPLAAVQASLHGTSSLVRPKDLSWMNWLQFKVSCSRLREAYGGIVNGVIGRQPVRFRESRSQSSRLWQCLWQAAPPWRSRPPKSHGLDFSILWTVQRPTSRHSDKDLLTSVMLKAATLQSSHDLRKASMSDFPIFLPNWSVSRWTSSL